MKLNRLLIGSALLIGLISACEQQAGKSYKNQVKPNIVFILADDLGYGDLGSYGQQKIKTPNLDRMALEGLRFTQAYSGAPVCAPARSVLMTGLHAGHTPIRGNRSLVDRSRVHLADSITTVAEVLKEAGYRTGLFGKWGLGEPGTEGHPNNQGFDEFYGFLNQGRAHDYFPSYVWHNTDSINFPSNIDHRQGVYVSDWYFEKSLEFIEKHQESPFFCYLPLQLPHNKFQILDTASYSKMPWSREQKVYAAMVSKIDSYVGQLLQHLQALGIDENTLVFFTSDNGPAKLIPGQSYNDVLDPAFFGSRGGLRGIKRDVWEAGIRVPMLVRWPGKVSAGTTSDFQWAFHDFLPTIAKLVGSANNQSNGISILPTLMGGSQRPHDYLYWEFFGEFELQGLFLQAIRQGDWKAVTGYTNRVELYNLSNDIGEMVDQCQQFPEKCKELEGLMAQVRSESTEWPTPTEDRIFTGTQK
ncbi:MAG: arylsulfatase [Cyclobacteriaceae bacterium]|nr:arylsulfatase [Cyclobacteriaceae bacterium HetDA_MAG_MS6]